MEEVRGEIITPDTFKARVKRLLSVNRDVVDNLDKKNKTYGRPCAEHPSIRGYMWMKRK